MKFRVFYLSSIPWSMVLILGSLVAALPSVAEPIQIDCVHPTSNIEYKECARRDYLKADATLNRVYKQIISRLSGEEKQHLIDAELAWITYRDKNCDFEVYRSRGGTGYSGFLSNCLERMTKARMVELQNWQL
jgi:uncharacterized protein YecT (DUF1311 family)